MFGCEYVVETNSLDSYFIKNLLSYSCCVSANVCASHFFCIVLYSCCTYIILNLSMLSFPSFHTCRLIRNEIVSFLFLFLLCLVYVKTFVSFCFSAFRSLNPVVFITFRVTLRSVSVIFISFSAYSFSTWSCLTFTYQTLFRFVPVLLCSKLCYVYFDSSFYSFHNSFDAIPVLFDVYVTLSRSFAIRICVYFAKKN